MCVKYCRSVVEYTLKNAGLFFLKRSAGFSPLGHFIGLCLIFFTQVLFFFFNPNAGFNLLGHFIGLFKFSG